MGVRVPGHPRQPSRCPCRAQEVARGGCGTEEPSERADLIDGALGELSQFDRTFGFYVHGLSMEGVTLPDGWKERTVTVRNPATRMCAGHCLEAHDLAASKLAAFRDKDREFVRTLLVEGIVTPQVVHGRLIRLAISNELRNRLLVWLDATLHDLGMDA